MIFKEEYMREQFESRDPELKQIVSDFVALSMFFGIVPVMTRVTDNVDGSSGVHEAGRAVDFRNEYLGKKTYTDSQISLICAMLNLKYARKDGKMTVINHSFANGPVHVHIQQASSNIFYVNPSVFTDRNLG